MLPLKVSKIKSVLSIYNCITTITQRNINNCVLYNDLLQNNQYLLQFKSFVETVF